MRRGLVSIVTMVLVLMAFSCVAEAQSHSVALTCIQSTSAGVTGNNFYRAPCTGTVTGGVCSVAPPTSAFVKQNAALTSACAYTDNTVTATSKFVYAVTAVCPSCNNGTGVESAFSATIAVSVPGDVVLPPTGLTAPTVALNTNGGQSTVVASWKDDPGSNVTYKLMGVKNQGQAPRLLATGSINSSSGSYALNWSGAKQQSVELTVCEVNSTNCKVTKVTTANNNAPSGDGLTAVVGGLN